MLNVDLDRLILALDDPIAVIRNAAAQELGKRKAKEALPKLFVLLEKDENALVRDNVAFALGEIGDPSAIPCLIRALKDRDEWVRKSAAKALAYLNASEAADDLIMLLNDPSPTVRKTAVRTLGILGITKACPYIERLLNDENILVKKNAIQALEQLKSKK